VAFNVTPLTRADLEELAPLVPAAQPLTAHPLEHFWCARWHGQIVAIGGLQPLYQGTAEAMFLPVPGRLRGRVVGHVARHVRAYLAQAKATWGLWRIHAMVHSLLPEAQRFAKHMGLEREARLRKYGPDGQDYWLYAWVDEEDSRG
jgi:hypothetical protein